MGKIVVMLSLSLDGFIEGPNREIDWHMVDEQLHTDFNEHLKTAGAYLEGRVTHELMAGFWPTADEDPSNSAPMREYAGIWRDKPKFVFSKTLDTTEWNTTVLRDVVPDQIEDLKGRFDGELSLGGAALARAFMELDLIDGYRLYIHPVVIGAGKRLFPPGLRLSLDLVEARPFGNGVILLRYER
jgi:dihydrofolate reductase